MSIFKENIITTEKLAVQVIEMKSEDVPTKVTGKTKMLLQAAVILRHMLTLIISMPTIWSMVTNQK